MYTQWDDIPQYFYDAANNLVLDECGDVISNIFEIISPNIMYLLKKKKENMFAYTLNGEYVELIYERNYEYIYGNYNVS